MSVKLHVSGLLASVCLFGLVAGSAVFAQDAVVDQVVVDQVVDDVTAVDAVPVDPVVVAEPNPVVDAAAVAPEAVAQAAVALAVPSPDEKTGHEDDTVDQLTDLVADLSDQIAKYNKIIDDYIGNEDCVSACADEVDYQTSLRNQRQDDLDHVNEEIRRRQPVVVVTPTTPDPIPVVVPAPIPARDLTDDLTPPEGFCASLKASGSWSDCSYRYRQIQRP